LFSTLSFILFNFLVFRLWILVKRGSQNRSQNKRNPLSQSPPLSDGATAAIIILSVTTPPLHEREEKGQRKKKREKFMELTLSVDRLQLKERKKRK
jgi:hypothetical protein